MSKSSPNNKALNGDLNINKPVGPTSHDIVAGVRRLLAARRDLLTTHYSLPTKVGHSGTLDPFASGVLLIAIGPATRLIEYSHNWDKTYQTTFTLGASSDTDDLTGTITSAKAPTKPTLIDIKKSLKKFVGDYRQVPPAYSAKKVAGEKLYQIARTGLPAVAKAAAGDRAKRISVHDIKLLNYKYPELTLTITCSTGTYIRSIARDLGEDLETGAYVSKLERTKIGKFDINDSIKPNQLNQESLPSSLFPADSLVDHLPKNILNQNDNVAKLLHGQSIEWGRGADETIPSNIKKNDPVAIYDNQNHLISVAHYDPATSLLHPDKVLN